LAKIKSVPMIIAAFIMLIVGIIIIVYGVFYVLPSPDSEGAVAIWVMVLVIGLILTFGSLWGIRYSEE
jgi:hypothetical protein